MTDKCSVPYSDCDCTYSYLTIRIISYHKLFNPELLLNSNYHTSLHLASTVGIQIHLKPGLQQVWISDMEFLSSIKKSDLHVSILGCSSITRLFDKLIDLTQKILTQSSVLIPT